jgi:hypothetical protein
MTPLREVFLSLWHAPVSRCSPKKRFAVIDTTHQIKPTGLLRHNIVPITPAARQKKAA